VIPRTIFLALYRRRDAFEFAGSGSVVVATARARHSDEDEDDEDFDDVDVVSAAANHARARATTTDGSHARATRRIAVAVVAVSRRRVAAPPRHHSFIRARDPTPLRVLSHTPSKNHESHPSEPVPPRLIHPTNDSGFARIAKDRISRWIN